MLPLVLLPQDLLVRVDGVAMRLVATSSRLPLADLRERRGLPVEDELVPRADNGRAPGAPTKSPSARWIASTVTPSSGRFNSSNFR